MVGARSPMSSAAVLKSLCSTKSCWCFEARVRDSQTGGRSLDSVTWTRFNRCARFMSKYSVATLLSFLSPNRLLSSRVSLSSTATSPTVSVMRVPAARLMLGSRPGSWLRSSWYQCWRRSEPGRGAEGSASTSAECVLGPDWKIAARSQTIIGR